MSTGEEIYKLALKHQGEDQQTLKTKGYNPGKIDGIFGNQSYSAVVAFQAAKGLVVDGEAGPATQKALGI